MPGERRGGRTRATPNRRTILADRMMAVLDGCSGASPKERLSLLINDAALPVDVRITVAQRAFPDRAGGVRRARRPKSEVHAVGGSEQRRPRATEAPSAEPLPVETMSQAARDALLGIVSDASASAKARRKAAAKLATYFLPKQPVNKRWRFTADECGFAINAEIAREYRTIDFELQALKRHPTRDFPEIAQRIRKLQARIDAIRQRLQCPPPEDDGDEDAIRQRLQRPPQKGYGLEEFSEDWIRLETFARKREAGIALSSEEDAEEAHRKARFDCYVRGPEQTARRRKLHLEAADKFFRENRFFKDLTSAPLSRKERNDLWLLRWLYPPPHENYLSAATKAEARAKAEAKAKAKAKAEAEAEALAVDERWIGHPFYDEKPAADGSFYPHDSKLRPAIDDEPVIIDDEDEHIPPYCILTPGQPPKFTYEPPNNSSSDKSGPNNARATSPST
jgi:hypothetical protein